ncbi:unnamed protein product [Ectocarpus sp. 6 AP-2014]
MISIFLSSCLETAHSYSHARQCYYVEQKKHTRTALVTPAPLSLPEKPPLPPSSTASVRRTSLLFLPTLSVTNTTTTNNNNTTSNGTDRRSRSSISRSSGSSANSSCAGRVPTGCKQGGMHHRAGRGSGGDSRPRVEVLPGELYGRGNPRPAWVDSFAFSGNKTIQNR